MDDMGGETISHAAARYELIKAILETLTGLVDILIDNLEDPNPPNVDTSIPHLMWMAKTINETIDIWPIDKSNRWVGFIQGVLATRGMMDTKAERNRTRPLFHAAYKAMGATIPKTLDSKL